MTEASSKRLFIQGSGVLVFTYDWRTARLSAGANQLGYLHYSPSAEEVADYVASYSGRINQVTAWFKALP